MDRADDQRALEQFEQGVKVLDFVKTIEVDAGMPRLRVWVITDGHDTDQAMLIFGIQDALDPEYRLDVKVRTRAQYDALIEVH